MSAHVRAGTLGLCPIDKEDVTWISDESQPWRYGSNLDGPAGYWMHSDGRVLAYDEATSEWSHQERAS